MFGHAAEDRVGVGGPREGLGVVVAIVEILERRLLQRRHASEHAASELLLSEVGEDALHLVQPARAGRREVQVILRMTL